MLCKKGVLRNFTKFTRKHLCQSLFLNKVVGLNSHDYSNHEILLKRNDVQVVSQSRTWLLLQFYKTFCETIYWNIKNCKLELHHRRIFYNMLFDSIHLVYPGKNNAQGKILTVVIIRDREVFGKFLKKYEKSVDLKILFLFFF